MHDRNRGHFHELHPLVLPLELLSALKAPIWLGVTSSPAAHVCREGWCQPWDAFYREYMESWSGHICLFPQLLGSSPPGARACYWIDYCAFIRTHKPETHSQTKQLPATGDYSALSRWLVPTEAHDKWQAQWVLNSKYKKKKNVKYLITFYIAFYAAYILDILD